MLSAEVLSRIKRLELKASHLASDALMGAYASAFKGQGWDFEEVRAYQAGDDLRSVDWPVTARMGEPHVKVFREERELTLLLLVDVSASLDFVSTGRSKRERAAELAAVLAFLAIRTHDKVGLLLFSDSVEAYIPPSKGKSHVWNLIRAVLTHQARGRQTNLTEALHFLLNVRKRRALVCVISDFWAQDYENKLKQLAGRHDVVCARILDEREQSWPAAGLVWVEDRESGERILIPTHDELLQQHWPEARKRSQAVWSQAMRGLGARPLELQAREDTVEALQRLLREKTMRGGQR